MKKIKIMAVVCSLYVLVVLTGSLFVGRLNAYGENSGGWTATEKRQVISLLEEIRDNTGE